MELWGGAQWLIIFMLVVRALVGAAKANGALIVADRNQSPWGRYFGSRFADAALLLVLIWGGFF